MFDLDLSDDRLAVADLAGSLGLEVVSPSAKHAERLRAVPAEVARALHDTGLTVLVDAGHGGGGIPEVGTHMAAVEALAYGDPGITLAAMWSGMAALLIGQCGTPAQQARWLPALAANVDAAQRSAVALYEGFGRSPSESTTSITAAAGAWRLVGRKLAVPAADVAAPLVVVGVDPTDGRLRAAILAGAGTTGRGVTISAEGDLIALGAAPTFTVTFDTTLAEDDLLGGADADPADLERAVGWVRLLLAAAQCGTAQRATDYASKYATERIAFGKPIASFQGVSFMLADAALRVGAARLEMFDAAAHLDARLPGSEVVITRAVNYAGTVGTSVTRDAIQVLGGHGFITDHPVELWYRSAAAIAVLDVDPLLANFEPAS